MAYDTSNRGSFWKKKAFAGPVEMSGEKFFGVVVAVDSQKEESPDYILYLQSMANKMIVSAPIYKKYAKGAKIAGGSVGWQGKDFWINVFPGPSMPDAEGNVKNAKGPLLNFTFQEKEAREESVGAVDDPGSDDTCPF